MQELHLEQRENSEHKPFDEEDGIRDCGVEIVEEVGSPCEERGEREAIGVGLQVVLGPRLAPDIIGIRTSSKS